MELSSGSRHTESLCSMKYLSLVTLTLQSAVQSLLVRYSRIHATEKYTTSTIVVLSEILKLVLCVLVIMYQKGVREGIESIDAEVIRQPRSTLMLLIPSGLYTLQTNLVYVALSHVDVTTYQVTYRLKVLTTAFFFVLLLGKRISMIQWISLFVLIAGIILVQPLGVPRVTSDGQNYWLGFLCLVVSSISSGFSGVYFEKILKGYKTSIWIRNIQLSIFGLILSLLTVYTSSYDQVSKNGFFYGYNTIVWLCVAIQAFGGLVTALVIKYADNMLKSFASSLAIVVSTDTVLDFPKLLGILLVIVSTFMYSHQ